MNEMWSEIEASYEKYKDRNKINKNEEKALDDDEVKMDMNENNERIQEGSNNNNNEIEEDAIADDIEIRENGHNIIEDESDTDLSANIDESDINESIVEMVRDVDSDSDDESSVGTIDNVN